MAANLPDDILPNIFNRLLAKQVAQMRCVCKPWNAFLSEPSFIKSHLHQSVHKNEDKILLFYQKAFSSESTHGPLTARSSHSPRLELTNFMKLKLPINPQHKSTASGHVIGSENGLICFAYSPYEEKLSVHIWNPSISALLTLPPSSLSYRAYILGFGFDPKTDDYMIVKLSAFSRIPNEVSQTHGEVYSMRKGSWESITDTVPSHIRNFMYRNEPCVNGHLHWLCVIDVETNAQPQTIVAFELGAMTYSEIPLPDSIRHPHEYRRNDLGALGGKLCLMSSVEDGECGVWVMDDDKSWVKHHAFSKFTCITPLGFTSHNDFLYQLDDGRRFALYDPVADKTKKFKIKSEQLAFGAYKIFEYVDSLVWITPANRLQI